MIPRRVFYSGLLLALSARALAVPPTIAGFSTALGDFDVLLHAEATPVTVSNFLTYVQAGRYDSSIIHRSTTYNPSDIQIVQGGGFRLADNTLSAVPTDPPITLEAVLPNRRGTLSMARTADPNSATSQWFFNVADNSRLDGGYAVFGDVIGSRGLSVVDAMGAVPAYNASARLGPVFSELPLTYPVLETGALLLVPKITAVQFRITGVQPIGNGVKIDWTQLSTNTPVRVERTTNLASGPWAPVSSNNTGHSFTDTNAPAGGVFYRVVTE